MTTDRTGFLCNSPLILAVASIRFAAWPLMAKKIDEIHDQLRDITPIIQSIQLQQINVIGQGLHQDTGTSAAWLLLSPDRSFGFQLAPDQLLFFSKKYTRFEDFDRHLNLGLSILFKMMRFIDVINLGVRYIDHIRPLANENLNEYVVPSLLPPAFPGLDPLGGTTAWAYKSKTAQLRVRGNSHPGAWVFPEDLIGLLLMAHEPGQPIELDTLKPNQFLLDMDASVEYSPPARMLEQDISDRIHAMHIETHQFFRNENVCTDHAFSMWKKEQPK